METVPGAPPSRPVLIVVSGPPGAGKTTLARQVARAVGCPAVCRDEIKEGMAQADLGVAHSWGDLPLPVPDHLARAVVGRDLADVIVPAGHRLAGRAGVTPRDLADEEWIAIPEGTICRQWLARMYDGTGRDDHVSMEFDGHLALVRAGLGIALVPRLGRSPWGSGWRPCRSPARCPAARSSPCTAPRWPDPPLSGRSWPPSPPGPGKSAGPPVSRGGVPTPRSAVRG